MSAYVLALYIISGCWILFAAIWLIAAFWTKRAVYKESRSRRLGYVIPILVGGYLVFQGQRLADPLNLRVIPHVDALAWTGGVLCIAGLAFCIWARFTLGRNWSGVVTFKGGHELITRGPYALVRHPYLYRVANHVRRNRDCARARRRNHRDAVVVPEHLDQTALRGKTHAPEIPRPIRCVSTPRETPYSLRPLAALLSFRITVSSSSRSRGARVSSGVWHVSWRCLCLCYVP